MNASRKYVAVTKAAQAAFSLGEFEHEFAPGEEAGWVSNGSILIVPVTYRVVGPRRVLDTEPGGTVEAALSSEQERSLVESGHLELVSVKAAAKTTTKAKE